MAVGWRARWIERAGAVLPFAFLIYILINASVTAFSAVVPFRGDPIDGAFQIFDPLRRIAAGQIPGVDFQFYHGILVPFVHYPLFALLGKTIFASELSRHFVSLGAFVSSLYFLFLAYTRKLRAAATLSTLAVLLLLVSGAYGLIYPGVSLPGLRSTPPLILFAILLCDFEAVRAAVALGLVAALAVVTSTEHGSAVILAFIVAAAIFAARNGEFARCWRPALAFIISLAIGLAVFLGSLSHFRGILSILRYNFVDVPKDQYWFFGSPPANAPASLADLFADPRVWAPLVTTLILLLASLIAVVRRPAKSMAKLPHLGVAMMLYALVTFTSYLARYSPEYSFPAIRICSVYLVLVAASLGAPFVARLRSSAPAKTASVHIAVAVLAICLVAFRPNDLDIGGLRARIAALNSRHWQPALDLNWQTYLNTADALMPEAAGKTIWATYSGLLHDHFGEFNPSTDYIIHVLGPQCRDEYLRRFRQVRPAYVETLPSGGEFIWEEWLHNTFWDFYQELLLNYTRKGVTNHSVIWERKSSGTATLRAAGVVAQGHLKGPVSLPLPEAFGPEQLLVVELEYETRNPWRWLPIIGRSPRFVVHWDRVSGPFLTHSMALPDYRSSVRFSLLPRLRQYPSQNPRLQFSVESLLPGAAIDVRRVSLSVLSLDAIDFYEFAGGRAAPAELRAVSFTDTNWKDGVWINYSARNQAGFFVIATKVRNQLLAHASAVVFNASGRRKIQSIERNGPYLNVFVDGPPLSPSGDGFPNPIKAE